MLMHLTTADTVCSDCDIPFIQYIAILCESEGVKYISRTDHFGISIYIWPVTDIRNTKNDKIAYHGEKYICNVSNYCEK